MPNRINKLFLPLLGTTIQHLTAAHKQMCSRHQRGVQLLPMMSQSKACGYGTCKYNLVYLVLVFLWCSIPSGSQCTKIPNSMMLRCLSCTRRAKTDQHILVMVAHRRVVDQEATDNTILTCTNTLAFTQPHTYHRGNLW